MLRRAVAALLILAIALGAQVGGVLRPLEDSLVALRMRAEPRSPTGNVVVVDIDAKTIDAVGSWPWPRRLYGRPHRQACCARRRPDRL
jgi:CHASE2 domain-containing sensor protein